MLTTLQRADEQSILAIEEEKRVRKTNCFILMFSMGSQFDHLIVMQVAKLGIYCLVADPATVSAHDIKALMQIGLRGIIISGGPASVYSEPPPFDREIFNLPIPMLGICLGAQMLAQAYEARVAPARNREFNVERLKLSMSSDLLDQPMHDSSVQQSHGDMILPKEADGLTILARTAHSPVAAFKVAGGGPQKYGVQFHPEVSETEEGARIFENFCGKICGITERFPVHDVAERKIAELAQRIDGKRVLIALSGGSDSSVVAYLLRQAKERCKNPQTALKGVYIKGVDRPDDEADLLRYFGNQDWIRIEVVDGSERFLRALAGKTTAKEKRRAFKIPYPEILNEQIAAWNADYVAQGTLYTDLVESGLGHTTGARRATIKEHHNTGLKFSVPELSPLDDCVKDNARDIGREIGVPETLLVRHPFPGPGLVIRIEGEITAEKLAIARAADGIMMEEIHAARLYEKIWQAGVRVSQSLHTTTKGDDAGVGFVIQWFAVASVNGFTARACDLPYAVHQLVADRMGNEIREVGAVTYRFSGKPYSTIEAE